MGRMRQFRRALRSCAGRPLAYQLRDGYGASMVAMLEGVARGHRIPDVDVQEMLADGMLTMDDEPAKASVIGPMIIPGGPNGKATAYVPVKGIAMYDLEYQPYAFSTLLLSQLVTGLANDTAIDKIVLDIASPGGMVTGTVEAADAVFAARKRKSVMALVNPLAASAAYWIASQATEIVSVKSGDVGSIGVFMAHTDCSAMNEQMGMKVTYIFAGPHKVEGNSDEPLSEEARSYFQGEVDDIYGDFLKAVAKGRETTVEDVIQNFGGGRTFSSAAAKKLGMVDEVATIDGAFVRWGVSVNPSKARRADAEPQMYELQMPDGSTYAIPVLGEMEPEAETVTLKLAVDASGVIRVGSEAWPELTLDTAAFLGEPDAPEAPLAESVFEPLTGAAPEVILAIIAEEAEAESAKRAAEARARRLALLRS